MASGGPPAKVPKMMNKSVEKYYYFVNINYPFLSQSKDEAEKFLVHAKEFNPMVGFDGAKFAIVANWEGCEFYYLYQFENSIPASGAKTRDFALNVQPVDTDEIFPRAEHAICIDLQLTTVSVAHAAATSAAIAAVTAKLKSICDVIMNSSEEMLDKQSIVAIIRREVPAIQCPVQLSPVQLSPEQLSPIEFDETTNYCLMCVAVRRKAEEMGFTVTTNKSGSDNSQASKYYNSRPDLVMYKENCGYIVMETGASEELTDETTTTTTTALHGGITENKNTIQGDVVGQLLAGMEKVAGDLAFQQLRSPKEAKERVFRYINIYGLVIDFEKFNCRSYKLTMDFVKRTCQLSAGRQNLNLKDGINRLVSNLERIDA